IGARPGKPRLPWSWRHWNGSRGSTTNACSNPSATFRPLRPKRDTIDNLQYRLRNLFYFNQTASAIPGAIQKTLPPDSAEKRADSTLTENEREVAQLIRAFGRRRVTALTKVDAYTYLRDAQSKGRSAK